ncbi:MAG: hypothetical protein ABI076_02035, partial [Acidobacteriaceae bacterium]
TSLKTILREILGLFMDDGSFAFSILVWVSVVVFLLPHFGLALPWRGVILFAGLAMILFWSAVRFSRQRSK